MNISNVVKKTVMTAALAAGFTVAAGVAHAQIYVTTAPPAAVVETRPAAPQPTYVWQPGYQKWDGNTYTWQQGTWVAPPRERAVWVPGRWKHDHKGYYWVEGQWR